MTFNSVSQQDNGVGIRTPVIRGDPQSNVQRKRAPGVPPFVTFLGTVSAPPRSTAVRGQFLCKAPPASPNLSSF